MKRLFSVLLITLLFTLSISETEASFGISPADITFENLRPGMTVTKDFLLSRTDLESEVNIVVEADIEDAEDWISVEPGDSFIIPAGQRTKEMSVTISVPADAPYQEYEGYILVKVSEGGENTGVSVVQGVGIAVNLITTRIEVTRLLVRSLEIPEFSKGEPLKLIIRTENQGNRQAAPESVEIIIYDMAGNELYRLESTDFKNISPGETNELIAEFDLELDPGEYQADVIVNLQGEPIREERLIFKIDDELQVTPTPESGPSPSWEHPYVRYVLTAFILIIALAALIWKLFKATIIKFLN